MTSGKQNIDEIDENDSECDGEEIAGCNDNHMKNYIQYQKL
jgi:hypothetical protein